MLESCRRCWSTQLHPATVTTRCTAQLLGRRPAPAPARQSAGGRPPSPATVPGISALLSIPIRPGLISMSVVTAPRRTPPDRAAVARRPAGPGWAGPGWRGAGTRDCFWDCRVPAAGGWWLGWHRSSPHNFPFRPPATRSRNITQASTR